MLKCNWNFFFFFCIFKGISDIVESTLSEHDDESNDEGQSQSDSDLGGNLDNDDDHDEGGDDDDDEDEGDKCDVKNSDSNRFIERASLPVTTDQFLILPEINFTNSPEIMEVEDLLDVFHKLAHPMSQARSDDVRTVGMVGYPNVGKSSTINVLLKKKRLAVSATPGRTKHLQVSFILCYIYYSSGSV